MRFDFSTTIATFLAPWLDVRGHVTGQLMNRCCCALVTQPSHTPAAPITTLDSPQSRSLRPAKSSWMLLGCARRCQAHLTSQLCPSHHHFFSKHNHVISAALGTPAMPQSNSTKSPAAKSPAAKRTPKKQPPAVVPDAAMLEKAAKIAAQLQQLYPSPPIPLEHSSPFQLLVAVMLSAQTTDKKVGRCDSSQCDILKPTCQPLAQQNDQPAVPYC